MSLAGIAAAVFLTWIITRPIRNLVHATQAVAQGDLSQRVAPWANDEIGRLALAFNSMTGIPGAGRRGRAARDELRAVRQPRHRGAGGGAPPHRAGAA